jgi:Icc-related predicted phosphoesterase
MIVGYCSDLHLDFGSVGIIDNKNLTPAFIEADILILAGDIAEVENMFRKSVSSKYNLTEEIQLFFKLVSEKYKRVIWVLGNHEYYGLDYTKAKDLAKSMESMYPNLHVLQNEYVVIDGVAFYGSTLWTDLTNPNDSLLAKYSMSDYKHIRHNNRSLNPSYTTAEHQYTIKNLQDFRNVFPGHKRVVITHHTPSLKSVAPQYKGNSLNCCFANNLDELVEYVDPVIWVHGHTHTGFNYSIGNTTVLCTPRGYQGYEVSTKTFTIQTFDIKL